MYNRPEQILEQYELEVRTTSKCREGYLCDTGKGPKILKVYQGSKERAGFLMGMLAFLREQGFSAETIVPTKEGEPVAEQEGEQKFLLTDAIPGAECDTRSRSDILAAVHALAKLHNMAEQYPKEVPDFVNTGKDSLLLLYEKHNRELNKVKNYIRGKKKKNDFEALFASCYGNFTDKASRVTELLAETEAEKESFGFCHGDYNQHNVIFTGNGTAVVRFERFTYHIRVSELANFIRKILEKNNWNTMLGTEMIEAYHNVRRLTEQELRYLYIYLAYPEKFWKVANHYYNSHKAWISERNIEKLEKVIAQEENRTQFLQMLFSFQPD